MHTFKDVGGEEVALRAGCHGRGSLSVEARYRLESSVCFKGIKPSLGVGGGWRNQTST